MIDGMWHVRCRGRYVHSTVAAVAGDDVDDERSQDGNGVVKSPGEGGRTQ